MISESIKKEIKYWITQALGYKQSVSNTKLRCWYLNQCADIYYYQFRYKESLQLAKNTYTRSRI